MRKIIIAGLLLFFTNTAAAQQVLNNDSIIKLIQTGLSEDIIIYVINASPSDYDTSLKGLTDLHGAGISEKALASVVNTSQAGILSGKTGSQPFLAEMTAAYPAMNNDAIIKMTRAGLTEDIIISMVETLPGSYDASFKGFTDMYEADVSENIIKMIASKTGADPALIPVFKAAADGSGVPDNTEAQPVSGAVDSPVSQKFGVGFNVLFGGDTAFYGANARYWSKIKLGFDAGWMMDADSCAETDDSVENFSLKYRAYVIPVSLLYAPVEVNAGGLYIRPYIGGGINIAHRRITTSGTPDVPNALFSETEIGGQGFGGAEFGFRAVPRLSFGGDVGGYGIFGAWDMGIRVNVNLYLKRGRRE